MTAEKLLEHQGAILLAQSDGCAVWQFRNETGDGTMTTYEIFSGMMLAFNDFHMERYECDFVADRRMLAIDHCREGRMDYAASDNLVAYTAAGDMKLDLREQHTGTFHFPSCHYHELTVAFDRNIVKESLPCEVRDFPRRRRRLSSAGSSAVRRVSSAGQSGWSTSSARCTACRKRYASRTSRSKF